MNFLPVVGSEQLLVNIHREDPVALTMTDEIRKELLEVRAFAVERTLLDSYESELFSVGCMGSRFGKTHPPSCALRSLRV